ncbi:MAG: lactate racemase domain-containing protein [Clostridium sp.]
MRRIQVPYGKTYQEAEIEDSIPVQLIDPECAPVTESVDTLIEQALDHPIASEKLENIVTKQDMPLIIVNDQTRPGPNREMVEAIVRRLEKAGIPDTHMRIIIATGSHRAPTSEELDSLVEKIFTSGLQYICHDCKKNNVYLGTTEGGLPIYVDKLVAEASFIITNRIGCAS